MSASCVRKETLNTCHECLGQDALKPIKGWVLPPESLAKFPRTCKSQEVAEAKPFRGFCALNPCGAASLAPPSFPSGFQQALTISRLRAASGARCTAIASLPTYKSSLRRAQPSALRHGTASTEPTAGCRERNPKSGSEKVRERRGGWMKGVGRRGGKGITFSARERGLS